LKLAEKKQGRRKKGGGTGDLGHFRVKYHKSIKPKRGGAMASWTDSVKNREKKKKKENEAMNLGPR